MIKGIIFDFDGLMVEPESSAFESVREIFSELGIDLPPAVWARIIGGSGSATGGSNLVYAYLEDHLGRTVNRELLRSRASEKHQARVSQLPPLPGVIDYIRDARSIGLKLAVASSSSRSWVTGHLDRLNLLEKFDVVKTREDVAYTKPHPDLFLAALDSLGLKSSEVFVLEDSPNGIKAANSAGIFCVVVPNPMTKNLPIEQADLRLDSLADLPFGELVKSVDLFLATCTSQSSKGRSG